MLFVCSKNSDIYHYPSCRSPLINLISFTINQIKATQYGVVELSNGKIVGLEEKPESPKSSWIATACWIISPNIFPYLDSFCRDGKQDNLGNFISYLIGKETIHAYQFTETWIDMGNTKVYQLNHVT